MLKASSRIDLEGIEGFLSKISNGIDKGLSQVADVVLSEAQASADFVDKTQNLRKSIKKRKSRFENGGYIVYSRAPHAHLVEFGHVMIAWGRVTGKRVKPHPFLRNARTKGFKKAMSVFKGD